MRVIEFALETGDDAREATRAATAEKLKPLEEQLRHLELTMDEVVRELDYLRDREGGMRNVNESTNARVRTLSLMGLLVLAVCGAWQLLYLMRYFKAKKLI